MNYNMNTSYRAIMQIEYHAKYSMIKNIFDKNEVLPARRILRKKPILEHMIKLQSESWQYGLFFTTGNNI